MKSKKTEIDKELLKSSLIKLSKEEPDFLLVVVENNNIETVNKINNLSEKLDTVINLLQNDSDEIQDMEAFKKRHRIKKEVIEELQELWKDEPPTEELSKMLD